jgi:TrmH family RNA methyltransferase
MGASFRLPAVTATSEEFVAWARLQRVLIWVADSNGQPAVRLLRDRVERPPLALVLGNEGAGVSPTLDEAADSRVSIPLYGHVESLNVAVAAGILLYELNRGR